MNLIKNYLKKMIREIILEERQTCWIKDELSKSEKYKQSFTKKNIDGESIEEIVKKINCFEKIDKIIFSITIILDNKLKTKRFKNFYYFSLSEFCEKVLDDFSNLEYIYKIEHVFLHIDGIDGIQTSLPIFFIEKSTVEDTKEKLEKLVIELSKKI